jgi:hypothetical protein
MTKLQSTAQTLFTPRNRKAFLIILTLVGMTIAGGAPGAGSGIGGGPGVTGLLGY